MINIFKKGFTLIELLVVIAIIGILAAMVTASFTTSQRQARDTQRKSDLSQYRSSLESYANTTNGLYLVYATATAVVGTPCTALVNAGVITGTCPNDPKYVVDPTYTQYMYQSNAGGTKYGLWAKLENGAVYWLVCSNGTSKSKATVPSIADCP